MASKLLLCVRRLFTLLEHHFPSPFSSSLLLRSRYLLIQSSRAINYPSSSHPAPLSRTFYSSPLLNLKSTEAEGPAAIDYCSLLQEDEFHSLADSTIHDLQEKFEEYGDSVQIDGFDIDYGNEVLTLMLGDLGTYVLNKQTPNRQLWLSSPVSGPSRFDWDSSAQVWVYRRTKENLLKVLESELGQLCGEPIKLG